MRISGSTQSVEENSKAFDLKQLIFYEMKSNDLRMVGKFLLNMAELLDNGKFGHSHRHIGFEIEGWMEKFPDLDIRVLNVDFDFDSLPHVE